MEECRESRLVWIDLEMTGLDPQKDHILEIATCVTDNMLQLIEEGPSLVIHADEGVLRGMSTQVKDIFSKSDLLERVKRSDVSIQEAESQTLDFIKRHCPAGTSPLCGNSVYVDRGFLARHMPKVDKFLHYRIIDVSTIKELVMRWYPKDPDAEFTKGKVHRAMADIRESIAELKHYRRYFFRS